MLEAGLSKRRKAQGPETAHVHTWIVSMKRDLVEATLSEPHTSEYYGDFV